MVLATLWTGCAGTLPENRQSSSVVVASRPVVRTRTPIALELVGTPRWETPDRLVVSVRERQGCEDGVVDTIATRITTTQETKNVALQTVGALALGAAGGVSLAVAPTKSDEAVGDETSPRDTAYVLGVTGVAASVALLGHAMYVALSATDRVSQPEYRSEVRSLGQPLRPCETATAGPGKIVAQVDDRIIPIAAVGDGANVTVEPRLASAQLCGELTDVGKRARLEYASASDSEVNVTIGQYDLGRCVSATVGRKMLAAAENALTNEGASSVGWAVQSANTAEQLILKLPIDDRDRDPLLKRLGLFKLQATAKGDQLTEPLRDRALAEIKRDIREAVAPTAQALAVAGLSSIHQETWATLYQAFVARAQPLKLNGYALLQKLLDADQATSACVFRAGACPSGVSNAQARTTLAPVGSAAVGDADKQTKEIVLTTAELKKGPTEKAVRRVDATLQATALLREVCAPTAGILDPVQQRCMDFRDADAALTRELSAHSERVAHLRAAITEADRRRQNQKIASTWRVHFAACRRLKEAAAELQRVSSCDSGCQMVRARMRAEYERLTRLEFHESVDDPALSEQLSSECSSSACPVCPE